MGDIAEGLINGDFDFLTGEYLGEGYGFPRTADLEHSEHTGAAFFKKNQFSYERKVHGNMTGIMDKINGKIKGLKFSSKRKKRKFRIEVLKLCCIKMGYIPVDVKRNSQRSMSNFCCARKELFKQTLNNLVLEDILSDKVT